MKKTLMLVTMLMSVLMLSACEHYFPYYDGFGDDAYGEHDDGHGYYGGGHGDGGYGKSEHEGGYGGGEHDGGESD